MKAEIITIGDEILIGQIVDTNSAFIAQELNKIGISVHQISSIQDEKQHILNAFHEAESRADIIIVTGGLGPTKDDITKQTLCEYFGDYLVQDNAVLQHIVDLFSTVVNSPITEINKQQALVPSKAIVLHNANGTAPGMYIKSNEKVFISLPGVPYEMKALIKSEVLPRLLAEYKTPHIYHRTLITQGEPESVLAVRISDWEDALPDYIKLAYLPSLGTIRLRLSAIDYDKEKIVVEVEAHIKSLLLLISDIVVGFEDESEEIAVAKLLTSNGKTLAVVESCTGGLIASSITKNPGASAFFKGGMVTYQTPTKNKVLHVDNKIIDKHSVVSEEVAKEMVIQVKEKFESDYAIATTGNAGPEKGDSDAEIGTVFIAIATPKKVFVQEFNFGKNRFRVIQKAKSKALELLRKEIVKAN